MSAPAVLSLGSVNVDLTTRVDELPHETGTTLAGDLRREPGGKGANVAVLVRRLGGEAELLAAVGGDDLARLALEPLRRAGVGTGRVQRVDAPTGLASIAVGPDGDKSIVLALGANDAWGERSHVVADAVRSAAAGSILVVDFEVPPSCVRTAVEGARTRGMPVVVDPAPPSRVLDDVVRTADHLTPDHREAAALTGIDARCEEGAVAAAEELRRRGVGVTHVKLPDGGCVVATTDGCWTVTAPPVDAVDTTGAGDAYAGGLAWALLSGHDAVAAAEVAVAAATCAVTGRGSQEAYPTSERLDAVRRDVRRRRA